MSTKTMWQSARAFCDAYREQHGRPVTVDLGSVSEFEMLALAAESGVATTVQPSGQIIGGVLESLHWMSGYGAIMALCTRQARAGDEGKVRR